MTAVPEWQGLVALGILVVAFLGAGWWLLLAPLSPGSRPVRTRSAPQARHLVATLVLASGALFTVGARWDELWHRMYGGFGEDFLWPPHLMMYAGLGLNLAFALAGLAVASGLRVLAGDPMAAHVPIRERFRAEPAIAFLGLTASFQMASIPSDLIWHEIIGPDLTAWSLPHVVLAASTTTVLMAGVALSRARATQLGWRADALTIGILATSQLALLQVGTTEWDWSTAADRAPGGFLALRPAWAYPLVTVVVGIMHSIVARVVTGRIGAASAVAAVGMVVQAATSVVGRLQAPPGPSIATAMAVAYGAVAMDLWWRYRERSAPGGHVGIGGARLDLPDLIAGTGAWLAGFSVLGLSGIGWQAGIAPGDSGMWLLVFVTTIGGGAVTAIAATHLGAWLTRVGSGVATEAPPAPEARPVPTAAEPRSSGRGASAGKPSQARSRRS
jgi:hypothetical protein